jgi:uncharacterized membrane protein YcfT
MHNGRVDWVDYAKGFCIVFVVMMHSMLGVEATAGQNGWPHPVVAFALSLLGLAGAAAVVTAAALMAKSDWLRPLRYCGRNSIVIYLAFFLPMAATRTVLLRSGWIADVGTMATLITLAGVTGALTLFWIARGT